MGTSINQLVGTARGKLGNFVYRVKKTGESYISLAPKKYKKTKKVLAITNRKRFAMNVKFAAAVNDSPILKHIWRYAILPGKSAYNKINISNHNYSYDNFMHKNSHITPKGRNLSIISVILDNDNLNIEFEVFGSIVERFKPPYVAVAMIHLYNPVNHITKPDNFHRFLTIEEEFSDFVFEHKMNLKFSFTSEKDTFNIINDYNSIVVYFTIISVKNNIGKTDWTNSKSCFVKGNEQYDEDIKRMYHLLKENLPENTSSSKPIYNVRIR